MRRRYLAEEKESAVRRVAGSEAVTSAARPPTMENLSAWVWRRVVPAVPGLVKVTVYRESKNETCSYFGPVD
jgi:hypothetical protein